MNHTTHRRSLTVASGLLLACWLLFATAPAPASASTATLAVVQGKPTLTLVAAKKESNTVYLRMLNGREFVLEDSGEMPDYSDVVVGMTEGSLPGCSLEDPYEALEDPANLRLRCQLSAVKRILLILKDRDDTISVGDGYEKRTEVPLPIFARLSAGNDQFMGGPRRDVVELGPGRDIAEGRMGNDSISGGPGTDSISGDESYSLDRPPKKGGNDALAGGPGKDYIYPGSGRDTVKGGAGNDVIGSVIDGDRDYVDCGAGRKDSLLGVDNRGIRFAEKTVHGCETVGAGLFGGITWSCDKRRCVANVSPYASRATGS